MRVSVGRSIVVGNLLTLDPARPRAEAMGIVDGWIVCVGTVAEVRAAIGEHGTQWHFPAGAVLPGLIDSHNHMLATGMQRCLADLSGCRHIADVVQTVREYARSHPERPWIVAGHGWHIDNLEERRYPTRWELDQASPERPVYLPRVYHSAACNSTALALAGITESTADPLGGRIIRDERGQPTGELHEPPAMRLVEDLITALTRDERRSALREVQRGYLQVGICGVIDPGLKSDDIALYQDLWNAGELKVRSVVMPLAETGDDIERVLERLGAWGVRTGFGDSRLKIGGIKVFLDGGATLGTALLREPYPDKKCGCGIQVTSTPSLQRIVEFCAQNRWSLGVHTVGGRAIDIALEVFAQTAKRHPIKDLRFSIIHAYLWPSAQNIAAARELGIAVATQPSMQYQFAPVLLRSFGREAIARATPLRSWLDGEVLVAAGSDSPMAPYQPLQGIWQAVTRYLDTLNETLGADQCISIEEALALYTRNAAWLAFSEHERGMLRPGLAGDWVALSVDPLQCEKEDLRTAEVHATAIAGEVLYCA